MSARALLGIVSAVRLPLLAGTAVLFRDDFVSLVERIFGETEPVAWAISLLSTLSERGLLFLAAAFVLGGSFALAKKAPSASLRFLLPVVIGFALFLGLFQVFPRSHAIATSGFLAAVLAVNTVPHAWLVEGITAPRTRALWDVGFGLGIGLSEILLAKPFALWVRIQLSGRDLAGERSTHEYLSWVSTVVLVPALAVLLLDGLDGHSLSKWSRRLHRDEAVQRFAAGNFNGLEVDRERRTLYAAGHGTNQILAFDLDALDRPPRRSGAKTGLAQAFAYNRLDRELYVYNQRTGRLLILDATTLGLKRSIDSLEVSPGDSWLAWDRYTDRIIVASEADQRRGFPTVVVDRATGRLVDGLRFEPGNIALHPDQPTLYMSFFRRTQELIAYDTRLRRIAGATTTHRRVDRMAVAAHRNQLLVASPLHSTILRFDAQTLEPLGAMLAPFGVRTLAVDPMRDLVLCGSLVTNRLEAIDLATERRLAEFYLGPWLRTITLDVPSGVAYVSSKGGLFEVRYAERLP